MKKIIVTVFIIIAVFLNLYGCSPSEKEKSPHQTNVSAPPQVVPPQAEDYFKSGTAYFTRGEYLLAIESFDKAIDQNPKATKAYIRRAFAYYKLGNRGQSLADIKVAADFGYQGAQKVIDESIRMASLKEVERDDHFIAYNDGTVLDTRTHLMWAAQDNGDDGIDWYAAKRYCANYRGGGYNDWRMPTLNELASLYDKNKRHSIGLVTAACITKLIKLTNNAVWAADTRDSQAANFSFFGGNVRLQVKNDGSDPMFYRSRDYIRGQVKTAGQVSWRTKNVGLFSRVIPVRAAESEDYLEVFFSGIAPSPYHGANQEAVSPPPEEQTTQPQTSPAQSSSGTSEELPKKEIERQREIDASSTQSGSFTFGSGFWIVIFFLAAIAIMLWTLKSIFGGGQKPGTETGNVSAEGNEPAEDDLKKSYFEKRKPDAIKPEAIKERHKADANAEDKEESKKEPEPDSGKKKKFDPSKIIVKE